MKLLLFLLLFIASQSAQSAALNCRFSRAPEIHRDDKSLRILSWTLANESFYFETKFERENALYQHASWVLANLPADMPYSPLRALVHHRRIIHTQMSDSYRKTQELARIDKMIEAGSASVRKISCLEALLFAEHYRFVFPAWTYSEFGAIVMISSDRKSFRLHFITERNNSGSVSMNYLNDLVAGDKKRGFKNWIHIHNHPFNFADNPYHDYAPIGPSTPDLDLYIKDDFEIGIITDGISSFPMNRRTYRSIRTAGD